LGGEGDRVVEEGEVPSCSVGGGLDVEFGLRIILLVEIDEIRVLKGTYEFLGNLTAV